MKKSLNLVRNWRKKSDGLINKKLSNLDRTLRKKTNNYNQKVKVLYKNII